MTWWCPAIRDDSPQARHHLTQADQVNQLVAASAATPDLGFIARMMALGGSDSLSNLQPLYWENNRHKGDNWPQWSCAVTS